MSSKIQQDNMDPLGLKPLALRKAMTDGTYYSRARAKIIYILATGLQSLSDDCEMSSIVIKTAAAVRDLDPGHGGAGALQYNFWFMVVDVATAIPHEHRGHSFLVELLANLDSSAGEEVSCEDKDYEEGQIVAWKDLPCLGQELRDSWIDPIFPEYEDDILERHTLDEWLNLNSFTARLVGAGLTGPLFGLWQLNHALEFDRLRSVHLDTAVSVASQWIRWAGKPILQACLFPPSTDEAEKRCLSAGDLYPGLPAFCLERWGFWKRRLGQLQDTISPDAATLARKAIEAMGTLESALSKGIENSSISLANGDVEA